MSSLLPRSSDEFQLEEYWDRFFTKRNAPFEWYGEYVDLCDVLHKYLKPANRVLVVGCGNSKLSEDLYDSGFQNIENIDISEVVIKQMSSRNAQLRPMMRFIKMDILSMTFDNGKFDCVIDKGTLDAICSSQDDSTAMKVNQMFSEIERTLRIAGRYMCITLAQDHVLLSLLKRFDTNWVLRVHKVDLCQESAGVGGSLPIFVFVITKMAQVDGRLIKVFEYVNEDGKCVRCKDTDDLKMFVKNLQQYSMVKQHLSQLRIGMPSMQLDLWSDDDKVEPRYTLAVVDQHKKTGKNGPFAIFIVPQGRETDWLFASDMGRCQLAKSAGYERLIVVSLHRGHTYSGLESVREEVGGRAIELLQSGLLPSQKKYPVLTTEDGIGSARILCRGQSEHSGRYVVEECENIRRLVFLLQPQLSQTTKVMLLPDFKRKKVAVPDHSILSDEHHQAMIAVIALSPWSLSSKDVLRVLIVGLGGGSLPMFIHEYLQFCYVDVVELDPDMVHIAEEWFGFAKSDQKLKVHVQDGIAYINSICAAGKKGCYDLMIFDVDSKDSHSGISSPPLQFVEKHFLENVDSLLSDRGLFVCNLAVRNQHHRLKVLGDISSVFPVHFIVPLPEDINEIVVGFPQRSTSNSRVYSDRGDHTGCAQSAVVMKQPSLSKLLSTDLVEDNVTYLANKIENATARRLKCEDLKRKWMQLLRCT